MERIRIEVDNDNSDNDQGDADNCGRIERLTENEEPGDRDKCRPYARPNHIGYADWYRSQGE